MIVGIGTDLISVERLRRAMERGGGAFCRHVFTDVEQASAAKLQDAGTHWAGRWAAKEALSKALGTGVGEHCSWLEMEVVNDALGKPEMRLTGKTRETFERIGGERILLSISHEQKYACAFVVIEGKD